MKITLKLNKSNGDRGNGYELIVYVSHLKKRKQRVISYSKVEHFNEEMQLINELHPDYDDLLPRLMNVKLKARKLAVSGCEDVEYALNFVCATEEDIQLANDFFDYCREDLNLQLERIAFFEKNKDYTTLNRLKNNYRTTDAVVKMFQRFQSSLRFEDLDRNLLLSFRRFMEFSEMSAGGIRTYLGLLSAVYNRGVLARNLENKNPFKDSKKGLSVKSFDGRKKYIDIEDVRLLENYIGKGSRQLAVDMFLLRFYFGGCDLMDLYYLKKSNINNGRLFIKRSKTSQVAYIKISDKAQAILDKYTGKSNDDWLFPWDKDYSVYSVFYKKVVWNMRSVQKELNIEVKPGGGYITVKVARHTFANRAKNLMIDPEIIRELMAHRRNDIDNFYKDRFPVKIIDEALCKIIDV